MTDERLQRSDALESALVRRDELHDTLVGLEKALASPGPSRKEAWLSEVIKQVERLSEAWGVHIDVTQGDDGLFGEVIQAAPRLAHQMDRLRAEHGEIRDALAVELDTLRSTPGEVSEMRERLLSLLGRLARHRQLGGDLLYEAYDVDLGGRG